MEHQYPSQRYGFISQPPQTLQMPPQNIYAVPMTMMAAPHASSFNTTTTDEDSGNFSEFFEAQKPDNEIEFDTVPGRLSLLGSNKKMTISLAEIKRRINAPECLNQSLLSAILRKAKNKDGGNKLNSELKKYNITLTQGRRKSAPNTAFTALAEEESIVLTEDFHALSQKFFPDASIAYEFLRNITSPKDYSDKCAYLQATMITVSNLCNILSMDKSPIASAPLDTPTLLHPESQKEFTNYSLLSHGFGARAMLVSWNAMFKTTRKTLEAVLDPAKFCMELGRPVPPRLMEIISSQAFNFHQQPQPQQQPQQFYSYQPPMSGSPLSHPSS